MFRIACVAVVMARILRLFTDQFPVLLIAGVGMLVGPLAFQAAHQFSRFVLTILIVGMVIFPGHIAALHFAVGVIAGLRVLVHGILGREHADRFRHGVPLFFSARQYRRIARLRVLMRLFPANNGPCRFLRYCDHW